MNFKNYDVVFSRSMASTTPLYQLIHMERVSDENGVELNFTTFVKIIKKFVSTKEFLTAVNNLQIPLQVSDALKTLRSKEELLIKDVEDALSLLKFYNYELYVVGRLDLNERVSELGYDYYQRSYLIENFSENTVGCSGFYTGYSNIYSEEAFPYTIDYIDRFGLTADQLSEFDLDIPKQSHNYLESKGELKRFDDSNSISFVMSRGFEYKLLVNSAMA